MSEEWTGESVRKLFDYAYTNEIMDSCNYIADEHNAALAAEKERVADAWLKDAQKLNQQLAAEREELAAAQAAIAEHNKDFTNQIDSTCYAIEVAKVKEGK